MTDPTPDEPDRLERLASQKQPGLAAEFFAFLAREQEVVAPADPAPDRRLRRPGRPGQHRRRPVHLHDVLIGSAAGPAAALLTRTLGCSFDDHPATASSTPIARRTHRGPFVEDHPRVEDAEPGGPGQGEPGSPVDRRRPRPAPVELRSGHGATPRGGAGPTSGGRPGRRGRGRGPPCTGGRPAGRPCGGRGGRRPCCRRTSDRRDQGRHWPGPVGPAEQDDRRPSRPRPPGGPGRSRSR